MRANGKWGFDWNLEKEKEIKKNSHRFQFSESLLWDSYFSAHAVTKWDIFLKFRFLITFYSCQTILADTISYKVGFHFNMENEGFGSKQDANRKEYPSKDITFQSLN